jgi:small basic protein
MFVTNHALAGAAIGATVRRPVAALLVGVASHFVMDAVPHWGVRNDHSGFLRVAVVDGLTGLAVFGFLAARVPSDQRVAVLAGAAGACLPDLDKPFRELSGRPLWPARVNRFHSGIQNEASTRMPHEVVTGVVLAVLAAAAVGLGGWRAGAAR